MKKKDDGKLKSAHTIPSSAPADVKNIKEKDEQNEVVGRHKNEGQIGHKGAR